MLQCSSPLIGTSTGVEQKAPTLKCTARGLSKHGKAMIETGRAQKELSVVLRKSNRGARTSARRPIEAAGLVPGLGTGPWEGTFR